MRIWPEGEWQMSGTVLQVRPSPVANNRAQAVPVTAYKVRPLVRAPRG